MKEFFQKISHPALMLSIAALVFCFWFFVIRGLNGCDGCNRSDDITSTNVVSDSNTVNRYKKTAADTVIKFVEKIIWKQSPAHTVFIQKTDTLFIQTVKKLDVMLSVLKKGSDLTVFAFNQEDTLMKEFHFADVGSDFTATSTAHNIFVKSKRFSWDGVEFTAKYFNDVSFRKHSAALGLQSGVTYLDKGSVLLGSEIVMTPQQKPALNFFIQTNLKILK